MYGLGGERRLHEYNLPWLAGYEGSQPVRVGNAAHAQIQLDVYGEILDTLHVARSYDLGATHSGWEFQRVLLKDLGGKWQTMDEGIWEVRGGRRHFTHSRLMSWVAFDRAVRGVEEFGLTGPVDQWRATRDRDPRRHPRQRLERQAPELRAELRQRGARRRPAADAAGRLPAAGRSAGGLHRRRDPSRPDAGRPGQALSRRARRATAWPGRKARSWSAVSGWPTRCR